MSATSEIVFWPPFIFMCADGGCSFFRPPRKLSRAPRLWRSDTGCTVLTSAVPFVADIMLKWGFCFGVVGDTRTGDDGWLRGSICGGVNTSISGAKAISKSGTTSAHVPSESEAQYFDLHLCKSPWALTRIWFELFANVARHRLIMMA